jgi:hypothetical protein
MRDVSSGEAAPPPAHDPDRAHDPSQQRCPLTGSGVRS